MGLFDDIETGPTPAPTPEPPPAPKPGLFDDIMLGSSAIEQHPVKVTVGGLNPSQAANPAATPADAQGLFTDITVGATPVPEPALPVVKPGQPGTAKLNSAQLAFLRKGLLEKAAADAGVDPQFRIHEIDDGGPIEQVVQHAVRSVAELKQAGLPVDTPVYGKPNQTTVALNEMEAEQEHQKMLDQAEALKYNTGAASPVVTGLAEGGLRVAGAVAYPIGLLTGNMKPVADTARMANRLDEIGAMADPGTGARIVRGVSSAIPQIAPAIVPGGGAVTLPGRVAGLAVGGVATGGPDAALASENVDGAAKVGVLAGHGVVDAAAGAAGAAGVEGMILARNALAQQARQIVARYGIDLATNEAQGIADAAIDKLGGADPSALDPERLQQLIEDTAITTLALSGGMHVGQHVAERVQNARAERVASDSAAHAEALLALKPQQEHQLNQQPDMRPQSEDAAHAVEPTSTGEAIDARNQAPVTPKGTMATPGPSIFDDIHIQGDTNAIPQQGQPHSPADAGAVPRERGQANPPGPGPDLRPVDAGRESGTPAVAPHADAERALPARRPEVSGPRSSVDNAVRPEPHPARPGRDLRPVDEAPHQGDDGQLARTVDVAGRDAGVRTDTAVPVPERTGPSNREPSAREPRPVTNDTNVAARQPTRYQDFVAGLTDEDAGALRSLGRKAKGTKAQPGTAADKAAYIKLKKNLGWTDEAPKPKTEDNQQRIDLGQEKPADIQHRPVEVQPETRNTREATPVDRKVTGFRLPADMARAAPRYAYGDKQFTLKFANDYDKAAYIVASAKPEAKSSKAHVKYVNALKAHGVDEVTAREHGMLLRQRLKDQAKNAEPGELAVSGERPRGFKTKDNRPRESRSHVGTPTTDKMFADAEYVPEAEHTALHKAISDASPVPVEFARLANGAQGAYHNGRIVLHPDLKPKQMAQVLGHELTHAALAEMEPSDRRAVLGFLDEALLHSGTPYRLDKAVSAARQRWDDPDMKHHDVLEEIFAEYGGDYWKNKLLPGLAETHPGFIRRIIDKISDFFAKLFDRNSLTGGRADELDKELREAARGIQDMVLPAIKELALKDAGAPMSIDAAERLVAHLPEPSPHWLDEMVAKQQAAREEAYADAGLPIKYSMAEKQLKEGRLEGTLENGAHLVNNLTRSDRFGGDARRAGFNLGGELKAWERIAEFWTMPGQVAWHHPGTSRDVYEHVRNRALNEGVASAFAAERLKPFTDLKGVSLVKVQNFLLRADKLGRELENDAKEAAKLSTPELAAVHAWRDTMKWALRQRAGMLWRMVGLNPPSDPLDAAHLRQQLADDEQYKAEHDDEKIRLTRRVEYYTRAARVAKNAKAIQKAIFERDAAQRNLANLPEYETTDGQPLAVLKARRALVHTINELAESERTAYVPHSWFGDYAHVSVSQNGNTVAFHKATGRGDLKKILADLNSQYGKGTTIAVHDVQAHPELAAISEAELRALAKLAGTDPKIVDDFLGDGVSDYLKARSTFGAHSIRRGGVEGFSTDLKHVGANYGVATAKWLANTQLRLDTKDLIAGMAESDPKLSQYWKNHVDYVLHPQEDYNAYKAAIFHMFLGGPNVMSAGFNLTQTAFVTLPVMSTIGGGRGVGELIRAQRTLAHMATQLGTLGAVDMTDMAIKAYPDLADDIKWAKESRVIEGRQDNEFAGMAKGLTKNTRPERIIEAASKMSSFLFGTTEKTNRIAAFVTGLRTARARQKDPAFWRRLHQLGFRGEETPREAARFIVDTTQFVYGKENRGSFNKGLPGLVFALKSYVINMVHLQYRLAHGATHGQDKLRFALGASMMTGIIGSMAGAFGAIPIVGDVVKAIVNAFVSWLRQDNWNLDDNLQDTLPQFMADTINHGVARASANAGYLPTSIPDVSQRASIGNFIPTKLNDIGNLSVAAEVPKRAKEGLFGVSDDMGVKAGDRVPGAVNAIRNMLTQPGPNDMGDLIRSLGKFNRGVEQLAQGADYLAHGVTSPTTGKTLIPQEQTNTSDAIVKMLGANTVRVSEAQDRSRDLHELATAKADERQHILNNMVESAWQLSRAPESEKAAWRAQMDELQKQVEENNRQAEADGKPSNLIKIRRQDIQQGLRDRLMGIENPKAVPKSVRPEYFKK